MSGSDFGWRGLSWMRVGNAFHQVRLHLFSHHRACGRTNICFTGLFFFSHAARVGRQHSLEETLEAVFQAVLQEVEYYSDTYSGGRAERDLLTLQRLLDPCPLPNPFPLPIIVEHLRPGSKASRQAAPRRASPHDPQDGFDDQPIIDLMASRSVPGSHEQRLQPLPLLMAERVEPDHLLGRGGP